MGTVHSYFLLVTDHPQARPVGSYSGLPSVPVHLTQTQFAHGTFSEVNIRVNPAGVVSSTGGLTSRIGSDCMGASVLAESTDDIAGRMVVDPKSKDLPLLADSTDADVQGLRRLHCTMMLRLLESVRVVVYH